MPNFASSKGQVMLSLKDLMLGLNPFDITEYEVEVREDWLSSTGDPYRGMSIIDMGEQYDGGTVGTSDIGYLCGIIFAKGRNTDATLADDKIMQWFEAARRRLVDQRLLITMSSPTSPREHVCIVLPGKTLTDPRKWPNYTIRQLVVASWIRELPVSY